MNKKFNSQISNHILKNYPTITGCIFSGILLGLSTPGLGIQWIGLFSFFPLNLNLEKIHSKKTLSIWKKALIFFLICWISGGIASSIGGYWITNSIYIFGHLPWVVSLIITCLGYGLEVGLQLFVYFGVPLLLIHKLNNWDLIVRLLFVVALDPWYPKLIQWNYGGLTFNEFPLINQLADIIGSSGLIIYIAGLTFVLLGWWRSKTHITKNNGNLIKATFFYLFLWIICLSYGAWRINNLESQNLNSNSKSSELSVLLIQPNFSLQDLASNPKLTFSNRLYNLESLLMDSKKGLDKILGKKFSEKLLVWPESVFPDPFFKVKNSSQKVRSFAKQNEIPILFTTVDWESSQEGKKFFGVSVLVDKKGVVVGRYKKIFLIPFGEMIPFSTLFPGIANWLRENISNMSEFDAGKEHTVFSLSRNIHFSAPICFDIFASEVIRKMVLNGSNLIVNLSNLAWFGETTASDNMVAVLRWRAIENRVPIVFASNNGKSIIIGANGKNISQQLGLFEEGSLHATIKLKKQFSFYRDYAEWLWGSLIILFFIFCNLAHFRGKIFSK